MKVLAGSKPQAMMSYSMGTGDSEWLGPTRANRTDPHTSHKCPWHFPMPVVSTPQWSSLSWAGGHCHGHQLHATQSRRQQVEMRT